MVLRDNLYADFLPAPAGADGVIRGPAGDGRVAAVAQDDIAAGDLAGVSDAVPLLTGHPATSVAELLRR